MNPYAVAGGWLITCAVLIYLPSILDRGLRNRAKRLARQNRLGQSREVVAPRVPLPRRIPRAWPTELLRENHHIALWEKELKS